MMENLLKMAEDTTAKRIIDGKLSRRDTLKLAGAGLGAAILAACGAKGIGDSTPSTEGTPMATGTPKPVEATATPELPTVPSLPRETIVKLLSGNSPEFKGITPENVLSFDFGNRGLAFFNTTEGINIGRLLTKSDNKTGTDDSWEPIYGAYTPDKSLAIWARATSGVTPVAPGQGVLSSETVFLVEVDNKEAGENNLVARFVYPDGSNIKFRIPLLSKAGKVAFAAPNAINFEEPTKKIEEKDIEAAYIEEALTEYMGVKINAKLITEKAIQPEINKVTISDAGLAEFTAKTIFKVWWKKSLEKHVGTPTDEDFKNYMDLWKQAQFSNQLEDWNKVAINICVREKGQKNKKDVTIFPMCESLPLKAISETAVNSFSFSLVNSNFHDSMTIITDDIKFGYETVLVISDYNNINVLCGLGKWTSPNLTQTVAQVLEEAQFFIAQNTINNGRVTLALDKSLEKTLFNGDLHVS